VQRIPEPEELMDDRGQALAYAQADFSEANQLFINLLEQQSPGPLSGRLLDLGCGPADIPLALARRHPELRIDAVDGSRSMLELAQRSLDADTDAGRHIQLICEYLPCADLPEKAYQLVASNSLLHHLRDPDVIWSTARRWSGSNTLVFVMDLLRPASRDRARELVDRHARDEPEVLRNDFFNSLLAAYRPPEVREQLSRSSMNHLQVEIVSDRHLIVWGRCHPREGEPGGSGVPASGAGD